MMLLAIRTIASLHLLVYLGIMWYGWKSYRLLRKQSWRWIGAGFTIFLIYRTSQLIKQLIIDRPLDAETTLIPFIGSVVLLVGFRLLSGESKELMRLMADPSPSRSGAQTVEFWAHFAQEQAVKTLENIRMVVREEIAAASGTTTVTVKGPAAVVTEPVDTPTSD